MSLYEDKGWGYLTSDSQDIGIYYDDDGSWGYRNEDGSGLLLWSGWKLGIYKF